MLADKFTQIFREEHRAVRDSLLDLIQAFSEKQAGKARSLLMTIAALTGPHFRYEEEKMYPALVSLFGGKYVRSLLSAHDKAIEGAKELVQLSGKDSLTDEDAKRAVEIAREILPHVSDCDGLSIMVERLPEAEVQAILDTRERCNKANLNLLEWAQKARTKPAITVP